MLTDAEGAVRLGHDVPLVVVPAVRPMLGRASALVYGEPATRLRMVGVTGTQGKTTTTRLLESGLTGSGVPAAVIGTVGTRILGEDVASALTTPEAPDLHRLLRRMVDAGVEACAMEVSSHALVMGRVDGIVFDVAVFLNLGRDHLDFHTDMEDYFSAKASLFTPRRARRGLVNVHDEWGRRLATASEIPLAHARRRRFTSGLAARDVDRSASGSRFRIAGPGGIDVAAGCPIPGGFNVGQHAGRRGGRRNGRATTRRRWRAPSPRVPASPVGSSWSTRARTSRSSSTTPTSPTRSRPPSPPCDPSPAAGSSW